jgi:carbamoyltransferase
MIIWGISANSHDAALSVFVDDQLVFASHAERYSGIKNDPDLNVHLIANAQQWGNPDLVCWYEKPFLKTVRQWVAGQGWNWSENNVRAYLRRFGITADVVTVPHHKSHAAATYYTSGWDECAVLVIDSIGEFTTGSIWSAKGDSLTKVWDQSYPQSLGLFYSAMTQRIGLKPQEDEYILMGMSAYGDPTKLKDRIRNDFFDGSLLNQNLHRGCKDWAPELKSEQDYFNIAAAVQDIYETEFVKLLFKAHTITGHKKVALAGGCALNCLANHLAYKVFDDVWIFPNPGDSGSAVGAVLAHTKKHIDFPHAFWGYTIGGDYPVTRALDTLMKTGITAVANGAAEFGPRSLGNRSLLADPRTQENKTKVNDIKKRQQFRPFAPAILEEHALEYFDLPAPTSRFMQFAVPCKKPVALPAVVHVDGTARVQTVPNDGSGFRRLLEAWYGKTGCPVLLNTSLNIKGMPIVNSENDARAFENHYRLPVFTRD